MTPQKWAQVIQDLFAAVVAGVEGNVNQVVIDVLEAAGVVWTPELEKLVLAEAYVLVRQFAGELARVVDRAFKLQAPRYDNDPASPTFGSELPANGVTVGGDNELVGKDSPSQSEGPGPGQPGA